MCSINNSKLVSVIACKEKKEFLSKRKLNFLLGIDLVILERDVRVYLPIKATNEVCLKPYKYTNYREITVLKVRYS